MVGTFCLIMTANLYVEFFLCWLHEEIENASTEYNASDEDLLLSYHILKWFWTSSFRCRSEKQARRCLRRKKSKVRCPFKFVIFVSDEDSSLMKDFYFLDHATSWCLNCLNTEGLVLAMAGCFPPTDPTMLRFKYRLHLSYYDKYLYCLS